MKTILTLTLALASLTTLCSQAPSKHSLFLDAGYSFNTDVRLSDAPVKNSRGNIVTIGGTYRLFSLKNFHTELGFAAKTIFSRGIFQNNSFSVSTLRIGMPLNFVYRISEKWSFSTGLFLQNNVDFEEFDFRLRDKYSWRLNLLPELRYDINRHWQVNLKGHLNLRDMADAYVINDPRMGFSAGIIKRLHFNK